MADDRDLESVQPRIVVEEPHGEPDRVNAYLTWTDLNVTVNGGRTILQHISGCAQPGRLLAIMGPSGSGKSTLIDTLAGRPARTTTVTGEILVNGRKTKLSHGTAAYLAQEVILLGTLTVFETLYYSAKLRFQDSTSETETRRIVAAALDEVGLRSVANTPIGNWFKRGVSGGEKRRVSIAIELLTSPHLLFLDEPTSGLDSASSFHVISTLKGLTRHGARTVLCSIHQPSSEVFEIFDDLCLLSGGQQVYFGPLPRASEFFTSNGYPCPPLRSASDHYLHCVNADYDKVQIILQEQDSSTGRSIHGTESAKQIVKKLTRAYAVSEEKTLRDESIERAKNMELEALLDKGSEAGFFKQSLYLTMRSFLNMNRDIGYYWLRILLYAALALCVGTVFFNIGHGYLSLQARASVFAFIVGFMSFMAIGGFPSFIEDMKVFETERMNGHYRLSSFVVANSLSSVPFILLISLVSTGIAYPTLKFRSGFVHVLYFLLDVFGCLLVSEAIMMAVSSLVTNFLLGILLGAGTSGIYLLVSGFYRLPHSIPAPIWKYPMHYLGYLTYGYQGILQNEVQGQSFKGQFPGDPPVSGGDALRHFYQVQTSRSKWWNLVIVFGMAVGYRVIFYILLTCRETIFPAIGDYIYKKAKFLLPSRAESSSEEELEKD